MAKKTAKKTARRKTAKTTLSNKRRAAGSRAAARSGAGAKRSGRARRNTGRRTAGAKTPKGKAAGKPRKAAARAGRERTRKKGGRGREETLAQTPETGRTVKGRTNPLPTRRSTGTAAGAGSTRRAPGLERARKQLRDVEEGIPSPPSSLDLDRTPSAARSGRAGMRTLRESTNETGPVMTGGDVDADWGDAYAVGDEAPGGDNPTPDQDVVEDIGKALGVEYQDNEELKGSDKIAERDKHRWELDPASSDDYKDRE